MKKVRVLYRNQRIQIFYAESDDQGKLLCKWTLIVILPDYPSVNSLMEIGVMYIYYMLLTVKPAMSQLPRKARSSWSGSPGVQLFDFTRRASTKSVKHVPLWSPGFGMQQNLVCENNFNQFGLSLGLILGYDLFDSWCSGSQRTFRIWRITCTGPMPCSITTVEPGQTGKSTG